MSDNIVTIGDAGTLWLAVRNSEHAGHIVVEIGDAIALVKLDQTRRGGRAAAGFALRSHLDRNEATRVRDALSAWIDLPRDLARSEADVVAAEPMADVLTELLKTKLGEWGVRTTYSDDETAPDVRWYAGDTAEREARTFYAELRGKTNCECGAEIDEDDAIVTDDGPVCDDCAAALHEEWLAAAVACVGVNGGKADEPCGWTGKGADARAVGGDSRRRKCPACGGEVELTEGDDAAVPS